ncbi:tetratricopeptide repeat protein [bacterium]|nr:tetratricopeptide repeat protein [bacterium]
MESRESFDCATQPNLYAGSMTFRSSFALALILGAAGVLNAATPAQSLLDQAKRAFQSGHREEAVTIATRMIEADPKDPNNYFLRARFHDLMGQREAALKDYDKLLEVSPEAQEVHYHRGVIHFLLGHIQAAAADFDQLAAAQPEKMPALWQRGIVLYYAGRYEDGHKQFEMHHKVNPNDVENAVWDFLCIAREKGIDEARKQLMPASGDTRIPMNEIYALFAGKGSPDEIFQRVDAAKADSLVEPAYRFYAHFYVALYYEATGNAALRREHLQKAVDLKLKNEYMWEVARVHLDLLNSGRLK